MKLTCRSDEGRPAVLGDETTRRFAGQRTEDAKFIHEMFGETELTSDFTGSVRCTAPPGEQEFTAVALELDTNNGIFTTLPVIPLEVEMPSGDEMMSEE